MRKRTMCYEHSTFKRSIAFPSPGLEVYTSVERIHCLPLWVDGSRWNAGHCYLWPSAYLLNFTRRFISCSVFGNAGFRKLLC